VCIPAASPLSCNIQKRSPGALAPIIAKQTILCSLLSTPLLVCNLPFKWWAAGWTTRVLGFDYQWGLGIFLFTTMLRTALGPTHPPIQWILGAFSLGIKRPEREADHSPTSTAEVKEWVELYIHSPNMPSWHGAKLQKKKGQLYLYLTLPPN